MLKGEGGALFASGTTRDVAGNEATANSETVKIDRTAPNTTADAPSGFVNNAVTVKLTAKDALSGVQGTRFVLDGGAETGYDPAVGIVIGAEGVHDLTFWSVDVAGNVEVAKTAQVKVDRTAPTLTHALTPAANGNGWNKADTTVTFTCADPDTANGAAGSGIKSCTTPQLVATEGFDQAVIGTAVDNADNSQTDRASVSLDKTAPTITGAPDRAPNAASWYKDDVIVGFTCTDSGSVAFSER